MNPSLQYSGTCVYTDEVRKGLKAVIKRLEPNLEAQAQTINEVYYLLFTKIYYIYTLKNNISVNYFRLSCFVINMASLDLHLQKKP